MYILGSLLVARRISAHTVTIVGVGAAALAVAASIPGSRWPLLAAVLILLSAVLDGVDGAVAVIGGTGSRWGYVLDTVADRCSDLCFLGSAFLLGAPAPVLIAVGTLTLLQESARARATGVGLREVGILTVWERPSRVVTALVVAVGSGVFVDRAAFVATMGGSVALVLSIIGFGQLMVVLFRRLR